MGTWLRCKSNALTSDKIRYPLACDEYVDHSTLCLINGRQQGPLTLIFPFIDGRLPQVPTDSPSIVVEMDAILDILHLQCLAFNNKRRQNTSKSQTGFIVTGLNL